MSDCTGRIGGFSNARYEEVAQFFGLDPVLKGTDIPTFELTPVYIPMPLFNEVLDSIKLFHNQYGSLSTVFNEAGVSYFISSVTSLAQHISKSCRSLEHY